MIKIENARFGGTELSFEVTEAQLATALAQMSSQQLSDFLRDQQTTVPELLQMIQYDWTGKANDLNGVPTRTMEKLIQLAQEHHEPVPLPLDSPRIRTDIDAATLSQSALAQSRLETLARNAESLNDNELETQLRNVGLLQHSTNLMR